MPKCSAKEHDNIQVCSANSFSDLFPSVFHMDSLNAHNQSCVKGSSLTRDKRAFLGRNVGMVVIRKEKPFN